jgi:glutathione synthase/RimK-type ligase-like ATP-grasp enzyme
MTLKIAIQPDAVVHRNGERQSYSTRWLQIARDLDVEVVPVDVFAADIIDTVSRCDAFMWRYDPPAHPRLYANRLLCALETGLRMPVFPSLDSRWHFEDKVGQFYFLAAAGIPIPDTSVSWTREQAVRFCDGATYPFVIKLATGYQASNVRLVHNRDEALYYVDQLFRRGAISLGYRPASGSRLWLRRLRAASEFLRGRNPYGPTADAELQYGYLLAQEFLTDNAFDVRVTVTGNRAFVFRRFNRPGDFRASGSGHFDWNPDAVAEDAVRLGYQVARRAGAQTITVDILRRHGAPVIIELGLAYASWCVRECPGHWVLHGEPESGALEWVPGSMEPADAIFADFVAEVRRARGAATTGIAA